MDAIDFFLLRYADVHRVLVGGLMSDLTETQIRTRPHPGVNTVAWLVWHMARIEDVGVNRFIADRTQVIDDGWRARLGVARRDVGTGMTDADVDALSASVDLAALKGYWDAVIGGTLAVVETLRGTDLAALVPGERVREVVLAEGVVAPGVEWLTEFWAGGRSRAWVLSQLALLHVSGHAYEARVAAGLWGKRSP